MFLRKLGWTSRDPKNSGSRTSREVMTAFIIDTNIFVRLLTHDVVSQFEKAKKIFDAIEKSQQKGLVSILVINETIWILKKYYHLERKTFIPQILHLLALKNLKIIEVKKDVIVQALELMLKHNVDFTDAYLFCAKGDKEIFSFDKDFKKLS